MRHGTTTLDATGAFAPGGNGRHKGENDAPLCNEEYGRWVPGGETTIMVERYAREVISGKLDFDTAVRLTEAITDAVGNPTATKRDLLVVLSRMRGEE